MANLWTLLFVGLFSTWGKINGYYYEMQSQCIYSSMDFSDMVYVESYIFNKLEEIRYNSTVGKFEGYTEHGIYNAEFWNNDTELLQIMQTYVDEYCKPNAAIHFSAIMNKTVEPKIKLKSVKLASDSHPAMLKCSVYNFYPKTIKVSWLRDGYPVTSDVASTEVIANGDWYYQVHSELMYTPSSGENISCVVEHASFKKPMIYYWDPTDISLPKSDSTSKTAKIAVGVVALVLGIVISAAGSIYYYKKKSSRS